MMYGAYFDVLALPGLGTLTVSATGLTSAVVNLSSIAMPPASGWPSGAATATIFFHAPSTNSYTIVGEDPEATLHRKDDISAVSWANAVQTAVRAQMVSAGGWSSTSFTVDYDMTTGVYSFGYSANFGLSWSTLAGQQIFGFFALLGVPISAGPHSGATIPSYAIKPNLPATSLSTTNYEPEDIASISYTDDGQIYGITREGVVLCRDWVQQFEIKAKTLRMSAAAAHPWTFQHLMEHCRAGLPFYVSGGFGESFDEVFSLREAQFTNKRRADGDDVQFHIPFKTLVEGVLTATVIS